MLEPRYTSSPALRNAAKTPKSLPVYYLDWKEILHGGLGCRKLLTSGFDYSDNSPEVKIAENDNDAREI